MPCFFGEPYPFVDGKHIATLRISTLQETVMPSTEERCNENKVYKVVNVTELKEILKDEVKKQLENH